MVLVVNDELKMGKGKTGGCVAGWASGVALQPPRRCTGWLNVDRRASAASGRPPFLASPPCCLLAGAQCAHAAVGAVERLHEARQGAALAQWERCGQPKICLRANSTLVSQSLSEWVWVKCMRTKSTGKPLPLQPWRGS